jgi:transmembrane sensor
MTYEEFEYKYAMHPERAAYLIAGFLRHLLSDKETDELDNWLDATEYNEDLFGKLVAPDLFEKESTGWYKTGIGVLRGKVLQALLNEGNVRKPVYALPWFRVAAAAVIVVAIITGIMIFTRPGKDWSTIAVSAPTLITPDGKKVNLLRIGDKPLAVDGGGMISKKNGEIYYSYKGKQQSDDRYYVLQVPELYIYSITLPDGTKAWLKAISSIRFPESFTADKRTVEIDGGAYFEIAEDKRPFIIQFSKGEIQSGNAHIAIDDRQHEYPAIVMAGGEAVYKTNYSQTQLRPGFRTVIEKKGSIQQHKADVEQYTIWRFGITGGAKRILNRTYENPFDTLATDSIK